MLPVKKYKRKPSSALIMCCNVSEQIQGNIKINSGTSYEMMLTVRNIEYAKTPLLTTNMTVRNINKQCGYRSYEHFAIQFKQKCSMTPIEFQKVNSEK